MEMKKLNGQSMFSPVTLRNFLLIAAGALLFFWPLAQQGFASIVACSGCSCVSEVIDSLASCTAIAQCTPEAKLLIVNASIEYLCPSQPVANQATTTGYIGGYNIYLTTYAQALFSARVCINQWAIEQCDGYKNSGVTSEDLYCCSPPPPPPPPGGGLPPGCTCCDPCTAKQLGSKDGFVVQASTSGGKLRLVQNPKCCVESPIVIDVGGHGYVLTSAAGGVSFDIRGTGNPIQMAWTAPGVDNAFLCLPDSNGKCDDGKDLFGNFTPQPSSPIPNGFAALAVYDDPKNGGNGDGVIDARDAIFSSLRLWIDLNHDGISQPEEMHTLPSLGVNSISLRYKADLRTDQYGNLFRYRAKVNPDDPDASHVGRVAYDIFFSTLTQPGSAILTAAKCAVPSTSKEGPLSTDKK
jgi:hypothetical protein